VRPIGRKLKLANLGKEGSMGHRYWMFVLACFCLFIFLQLVMMIFGAAQEIQLRAGFVEAVLMLLFLLSLFFKKKKV
jgi:uncharacterized membrane protein YhaH (DUF805 family)